MATRKPAAKTSTALTVWEQEMAATAKVQHAAEKPMDGGKSISFKNGRITVDDEIVKGDELDVVVLASMFEYQFYEGTYNADTVQIPICYAFGNMKQEDPSEGMAPHPKSEKPQCETTCADCDNFQWGSADVGRGKACKEVRKLKVISADAVQDAKELKDAEVRGAKIPVTSLKNWAKYVRSIVDEVNRPFWGVVTKISTVPHDKHQFEVKFDFVELIQFNQPLYDAMKKKVADAEATLGQPYQKPEQDERLKGKAAAAGKASKASKGAAPAGKKAPLPATKKAAANDAKGTPARKRAF